jgi:hypothetical protein
MAGLRDFWIFLSPDRFQKRTSPEYLQTLKTGFFLKNLNRGVFIGKR